MPGVGERVTERIVSPRLAILPIFFFLIHLEGIFMLPFFKLTRDFHMLPFKMHEEILRVLRSCETAGHNGRAEARGIERQGDAPGLAGAGEDPRGASGDGPSTRPNRVSVCVARTLNPIGQVRATLSQWQEQLRAGLWVTAGENGA